MAEGHKVLLVDDEETVREVLSVWLEEGGYHVRTATDGVEAVAEIEADCPDILITDWRMPNMDGLELCDWLHQQDLPHPVYTLFVTVRSEVEAVVQALSAGADDFLSKPVCESELLGRVHLASRRLRAGSDVTVE